jgi:hypothetical protein
LISSEELEFEVDPENFSLASFDSEVANWMRKCRQTQWVRIEDSLYWYNGGDGLKINSHLYHKLL